MPPENESPGALASASGALEMVRQGSSNRFKDNPAVAEKQDSLSDECRKSLYMNLYHRGVLTAAQVSYAFAANPRWRSA